MSATAEETAEVTGDELEGRCEAETTAGGTTYQCALQEGHDGDHSFSPVDELTADPADDAEPEPESGDDEPPASEPPAEPPSDQVMEQIGKALDKEADRHTKAVAKIMGDSMGDLVTCPLCITPGFVTVEPPADFDPGQREAVLAAMGEGGANMPKQHPVFETCESCNGLGVLLTGARNDANYTVNCPDCDSRGYVDPADLERKRQAAADAAAYANTPVAAPATAPPAAAAPNGTAGTPPQPWFDYVANEWKLP